MNVLLGYFCLSNTQARRLQSPLSLSRLHELLADLKGLLFTNIGINIHHFSCTNLPSSLEI